MTVEPRGPKAAAGRQYQVRFTLELEHERDKVQALSVAHDAMAPMAAQPGAECAFGELAIKTKTTSIEARAAIRQTPSETVMQELRATLSGAGYTVSVTELRECDECLASVMVPWNQRDTPPTGWHSSSICGKHHYRSCGNCGSVYVMSSSNASGPAPSLHCEVCNTIMVEWGGTKVWLAELVTKN
ncbi:MAG TPA: hypothetical protein VF997_01995 [Polyangia bacterium]